MIPEVAHTAEFQRVTSLPRRVWSADDLAYLSSSLTEIFRTPANTPCVPVPGNAEFRKSKGLCLICGQPLQFNAVQALALHDAGTVGGLFGAIGVGEGKTLISFFLSAVTKAERPLLLVPGGLVEKTQRERLALSQHWRIPDNLRVFSYDVLGRVDAKDELDTYEPDLLILEEGHKAKNKRAARTRVIARYMHKRPETKVAVLSGTVMDKSIKDFAHLLLWCLKWNAPIPTSPEEIEEWAQALDEGVDEFVRFRPGALLEFATPEERAAGPAHVAARHGFRRRLTETPGVVATIGEGEHVDCSIYVRAIRHKVSAQTEWNFLHLRGDGKSPETTEHPGWQTPDDWELMSGVEVWQHAQELALGLFYVWDPRPPQAWRDARREWHSFVRERISKSKTYDSELHVAMACDAGKLDASSLNKWRAIEPTFTPNVKAIWCDDSALVACRDWAKSPGLIWTEHAFFAQRLAEFAGLKYYGAGGFAADGSYIEDARPGSSAIASIDANREGKNLQKLWNRNLVVCPPTSAAWWEQKIARTHRPGQEADEVIVDVMLGCRENFDACQKALAGAAAIRDLTGKQQKLLLADVVLPTEAEIDALRSPRWQK